MAWVKNLQRSDVTDQPGAQVEDGGQAGRERDVNLGVGSDNVGAPAAALVLMIVQTDSDFLELRVSGVGTRKLVITYSDNVGDDSTESEITRTAGIPAGGGITRVDGGNELEDDLVGAVVVAAAIELLDDGAALVAEVGPGGLELVDRPLLDDFRDSASEGHGTGGEDSEDGGETHCEEV